MKRWKSLFTILFLVLLIAINGTIISADDFDGDWLPLPIPHANYNGQNGQLENTPDDMLYSFDGQNYQTYIQGTSIDIGDYRTIYAYQPGDDEDTWDSPIQQIVITVAATPTATPVTPTDYQNNDGKIIGLGDTSQFSSDDGENWDDVDNGRVEGLSPGDYAVRNAGGFNRIPSIPQIVTVPAHVSRKMPTPDARFEASTMTLSNLKSSYEYSLDGGYSYYDVTGSSMVIHGVSEDNDIKLINRGIDEDDMDDSDEQTIDIQRRPTPNPQPKDINTNGGTGGITNVHSDMEYREDKDGSSWRNTGEEVKGLKQGDYLVRQKGSQHYLASHAAHVTIHNYSKQKASTPNVTFNCANMELGNVKNGMRISLDGGNSWFQADHDGNITIDDSLLSENTGIRIYMPGNDSTSDSDTEYIGLNRNVMPTGLSVLDATSGNNGVINGTNQTMQYRNKDSGPWINITSGSLVGLKAGTYLVRTMGAYTYLPSQPVNVIVGAATKSDQLVTQTTQPQTTQPQTTQPQTTQPQTTQPTTDETEAKETDSDSTGSDATDSGKVQKKSNSNEDMEQLLTKENELGIVKDGADDSITKEQSKPLQNNKKVKAADTEEKPNWGLILGAFAGITLLAVGSLYLVAKSRHRRKKHHQTKK